MEDAEDWMWGLQNGVTRYYSMAKAVSRQPTSTYSLGHEVKPSTSSWPLAEHGPRGAHFPLFSPPRPLEALSFSSRACFEPPTGWPQCQSPLYRGNGLPKITFLVGFHPFSDSDYVLYTILRFDFYSRWKSPKTGLLMEMPKAVSLTCT